MRPLLILLLLLFAPPVRAIEVLSAGAVEHGLAPVLAAFASAGGQAASVRYATAPRLRQALAGGTLPHLLIAPADQIADLQAAGRLGRPPVPLGRVGIGAAVRIGAAAPRLDNLDGMVAAVLGADRVVFNRASTGLFLDGLFARLGIAEAVGAKAARYATAAEVMRHIVDGHGAELGLAPIPEILLARDVHFVGPLPEAAQNRTAYLAAVPTDPTVAALALLEWLARPASRETLARAGIEPP